METLPHDILRIRPRTAIYDNQGYLERQRVQYRQDEGKPQHGAVSTIRGHAQRKVHDDDTRTRASIPRESRRKNSTSNESSWNISYHELELEPEMASANVHHDRSAPISRSTITVNDRIENGFTAPTEKHTAFQAESTSTSKWLVEPTLDEHGQPMTANDELRHKNRGWDRQYWLGDVIGAEKTQNPLGALYGIRTTSNRTEDMATISREVIDISEETPGQHRPAITPSTSSEDQSSAENRDNGQIATPNGAFSGSRPFLRRNLPDHDENYDSTGYRPRKRHRKCPMSVVEEHEVKGYDGAATPRDDMNDSLYHANFWVDGKFEPFQPKIEISTKSNGGLSPELRGTARLRKVYSPTSKTYRWIMNGHTGHQEKGYDRITRDQKDDSSAFAL